MTALFIIIIISGTAALGILFIRKIPERTPRISMWVANVVVALTLVVLFVAVGNANTRLKRFLEQQAVRLELSVNRIYPGAFEKSFSTTEVKEMLKSCLATFESPGSGIEAVVMNLVRMKSERYISRTLSAINAIEQTEGTVSLKDAVASLESLLLERTAACFRIIRRVLIFLYALFFAASLCVSLYLTKVEAFWRTAISAGA